MTNDRQLLADPPTATISTTSNHKMQLSIGALCWPNLTQHHYNFIMQREMWPLLATYDANGIQPISLMSEILHPLKFSVNIVLTERVWEWLLQCDTTSYVEFGNFSRIESTRRILWTNPDEFFRCIHDVFASNVFHTHKTAVQLPFDARFFFMSLHLRKINSWTCPSSLAEREREKQFYRHFDSC
jgi:hypothetical protein